MTSDGGEVLPAPSPAPADIDGSPEVQLAPTADDGENEDRVTDETASESESEADTETPLEPEIGGERKSNHAEAVPLFCDLVTRGYQTLVFTRTRQGAERCAE